MIAPDGGVPERDGPRLAEGPAGRGQQAAVAAERQSRRARRGSSSESALRVREPLECTPLPPPQLGRAGVEQLVGATDVVGPDLGRGQGDRLVVGVLPHLAAGRTARSRSACLVLLEGLIRPRLLGGDGEVADGQPGDRRDGRQGADHDQGRGRRPPPGPLDQSLDAPRSAAPGSARRPASARGRRPAPRPSRSAARAPWPGTSGRSSPGRGRPAG